MLTNATRTGSGLIHAESRVFVSTLWEVTSVFVHCWRMPTTLEGVLSCQKTRMAMLWPTMCFGIQSTVSRDQRGKCSQSSCPEHASTYQCCDANGHSAEGARCRSNFQCPVDPCLNHSCAHNASCQRTTPTSHPTKTLHR
jgi:hypothetical protein